MYKQFFGLRENPFSVNPDPRFLFLTPQTKEALDNLTYGIQSRQGLVLLTGEVGTGKTTLLNRLLDWLHQQQTPTAFIFNSHIEVSDFFDLILADFGVKFDSRLNDNALMRLHQWLFERYRAGDTPVVIVDEAQGLSNHVFEQIRMLLNLETSTEKLLQIVIAGQPELEERLQQSAMRQIKQRIALRCKTAALTIEDAHHYIEARLHIAGAGSKEVFGSEAMDAVHRYSRGIPRVMNLLCEHALINAYVDHVRPVPAHIVADAAREFQFDDFRPVAPSSPSGAAAASDLIPVQSRFMNAVMPRSEMTEPLWEEQPSPSAARTSGSSVVADNLLGPSKEISGPILECEKIQGVKGRAETSRPAGVQLSLPTVLGLKQVEARLLSEWTAFLNDVGTSLASELPTKPALPARPARLHLVEAKKGFDPRPDSGRYPACSPQKPSRPPSAVDAAPSVPLYSGLMKIVALRPALIRWSKKWRNHPLSIVTSLAQIQRTMVSWQGPKRSFHLVRAPYRRCLARADRCLTMIGLIDWSQLRRSLRCWLRQPCDPTQWYLPDSRKFDALVRFNYKKMKF
jgi:general secretion pathway protein A